MSGKQLSLVLQDDLIVKSNRFVSAKYDWSTLEHRVVAMMVAQLRKEDGSFGVQRLRVKDIIEMSGASSKDIYNRVEEICSKLLAQKIEVRSVTEDGRREYEGYNLMSSCKYVEGSGFILAKFNDDMKPFLLELKRRFTMYRLQFVMQLRSQYSIRVYELLKMREDLRFVRLTIEELREILCLEHKYTRSFSSLRTNVLERAREELREKCDIYFTYHVERDGRTPVRINFMIHSNDNVKPAISPDEISALEKEGEMLSEGLHRSSRSAGRSERSAESQAGGRKEGSGAKDAYALPRVDGYYLFLGDRAQQEIEAMTGNELDALHEQAKMMVLEQHPEIEEGVFMASEVYRIMNRLWAEQQ